MCETETSKANLLIIDDELQVRSVLHEFLGASYRCVAVNSAEEALALLATEKFDLVISDITMGRMSGLEMVPYIRELAPQTVIVMISAQQTIEYAIKAMRAGAFDYIAKPFDLRQVEAVVHRALTHHQICLDKQAYENELEKLLKQRTAQVEHLAHYDALTGLPNRALFECRVARDLSIARQSGQTLGTILLALNSYTKINDTLGHAVGDLLLKGIAERLKLCIGAADALGRFDGDEFALLLNQVTSRDDMLEISRSINEALKPPFILEGHMVYVSAHMGIAWFPGDGEDGRTLLKNAGAALYCAKLGGGKNYQLYSAEMSAFALKLLTLESSLRTAVENREFVIHYQPQLDLASGKIVGAEALVRWQHPELGLLSPADFIPLAEATGLILPIGAWVLRSACKQARQWQQAGFQDFRIAVNVSPRQFQDQEFLNAVMQTVGDTGLDATCLELELTETAIMENAEAAVPILTGLREMGVKIAIDDFGTGYSSLSYLKRLPVDRVKLDKSFIGGVATDPDAAALLLGIVKLAHSLRLKVIAEGVETEDHWSLLKLIGCDEGQGYLFGLPVAAPLFESLTQLDEALSPRPRSTSGRISSPLVNHDLHREQSLRLLGPRAPSPARQLRSLDGFSWG